MAAPACSIPPRDDRNLSSLLEMFGQMFREPFIAQQYLPDVRKGDKRIILVDGEPVGAINRVPAEHDAAPTCMPAAAPELTELTAREKEICARIGPALRERGFLLVGIDVIGDYMTEINVTSPTGIREVKKFGGADIASLLVGRDRAQARLKQYQQKYAMPTKVHSGFAFGIAAKTVQRFFCLNKEIENFRVSKKNGNAPSVPPLIAFVPALQTAAI